MNTKGNFLVVDDEKNIQEIIKRALLPIGNKLFSASTAEEAMELLKENNIDVVVSDIQMPGISGLEFLHKIKEEQPEVQFLMITAHGTMDVVIKALRYGASDFLTKPFDNKNLLTICSRLLLEKCGRLEPVENISLSGGLEGIIGKSSAFQDCLKIAVKAAAGDSNVLILGESGTGKEVFAKAIHDNSPRRDKPFIPVNCGAIPENLMESELFGHEKGAFTGAGEKKPGKFQLADEGTIFLDEIGELPLSMQVKLLRVLQDKKVESVGHGTASSVNFRTIAATNRNLQKEIRENRFREDLFYRLNVIPITLPPLRNRGEDCLLLADHLLRRFNQRYNTQYLMNENQRKDILAYSWPGNIREMENIMERAVVLGEGELALQVPMGDGKSELAGDDLKSNRKKAEKDTIVEALKKNGGNKSKTAVDLSISRRSLLYKVKEFGITD